MPKHKPRAKKTAASHSSDDDLHALPSAAQNSPSTKEGEEFDGPKASQKPETTVAKESKNKSVKKSSKKITRRRDLGYTETSIYSKPLSFFDFQSEYLTKTDIRDSEDDTPKTVAHRIAEHFSHFRFFPRCSA
jgi:hypothetical protein